MKPERTVPYTIARLLAWVIVPLFFGGRCEHAERFPQEGNCLVVSNHISAWDPILVSHYYRPKEIRYLSKAELFRNPLLARFMRSLHCIRVERGESDLHALRESMKTLADGHTLGIFPEGHRQFSGKLGQLETGVAVIALRSKAPVIPCGIRGSFRLWGRPTLRVGDAVDLSDLRALRPDAEVIERVKARLADALEALRHGEDPAGSV